MDKLSYGTHSPDAGTIWVQVAFIRAHPYKVRKLIFLVVSLAQCMCLSQPFLLKLNFRSQDAMETCVFLREIYLRFGVIKFNTLTSNFGKRIF